MLENFFDNVRAYVETQQFSRLKTAEPLAQDHDLDMRGGQIYKAGERPADRPGSPLASRQSSPVATATPAEIRGHAGQR